MLRPPIVSPKRKRGKRSPSEPRWRARTGIRHGKPGCPTKPSILHRPTGCNDGRLAAAGPPKIGRRGGKPHDAETDQRGDQQPPIAIEVLADDGEGDDEQADGQSRAASQRRIPAGQAEHRGDEIQRRGPLRQHAAGRRSSASSPGRRRRRRIGSSPGDGRRRRAASSAAPPKRAGRRRRSSRPGRPARRPVRRGAAARRPARRPSRQ